MKIFAHLFILPPQSTLTIHVGKRKIKLRPEEVAEGGGRRRGRRGSLMRGLQRIDRVGDRFSYAAARATAKSNAFSIPSVPEGISNKFT